MKIKADRYLPYVVITAVLMALPALLGFNAYYVLIATWILFYAVLVSGWNIIYGFAGQIDLAAGAYIGLGAFTSGTLLIRWGITPWIGMFLGGLVAAGFAILIGYPTFRFGIREVWYALASLAIVKVLERVFTVWEEIGGPVERYLGLGRFWGYDVYYYLLVMFLITLLALNIWIKSSKLGCYFMAVRENEEAAEMLGVDTRKYKLKALLIYAFITGVVGGPFACITGYIHPSHFDTWISSQVAILGMVGGVGSIFGPPVTAFILVSVSEYLRTTLGATIVGLHLIFYGIVLMIIVLFKPEGLAPLFETAYKRLWTYLSAGSRER